MNKKIALLGIDMQNDFTDATGALYVQGADRDMVRTIDFVKRNANEIDYIALTLDSHQPIHIAHQCYWRDEAGRAPELFSTVSYQSVVDGNWIPQYHKEKALPYLKELNDKGEVCTIWPMHCILGTHGWSIHPQLMNCLIDWSINNDRSYELFYKGYAQNTEHYSIFRAAVEWSDQPETSLNISLLNLLNGYDHLIVVGQAADFCIANSLNDILLENECLASKVVVLTDCMSWIIADNERANSIWGKARQMGVRFEKSVDYIL